MQPPGPREVGGDPSRAGAILGRRSRPAHALRVAHRTASSTLFGGVIGRELAAALGPQLGPNGAATLIKTTARDRSTADPLAGTRATATSYDAQGFVASYEDSDLAGGRVQTGDRKIVLLGVTIQGHGLTGVVPEPGDRVTIGGETYQIVTVAADPALATYTCQGRK